jgi:hypothetical protein
MITFVLIHKFLKYHLMQYCYNKCPLSQLCECFLKNLQILWYSMWCILTFPTKLLVYQVCPIGLFLMHCNGCSYIYIYICMKVLFSHLLTLELDIVFLNNYFTRYLNDIHGVAIVHSIVVLICASHDGRI